MRLSGIKLAGFKSFVDPTQLPLPSNLSGIVGPNGCGKSNLIDAVRWVLGESSMKTLRGQDSEDVIFNGSRTRGPVGRASVELIFDNADRQIQGPFAAYNEIAVRRELTRDGHSQYYLNSRKCLKRDVTDLFLGTGLGGRNQYAIIEQGMVSRMVEARPEDLRVWLEEASGISRYKERRRDTETRIRQTRENLERLADLREEVDKRLDTLRRQAANAESWRRLKNDERLLRAGILRLRLDALDALGESQRDQLQGLTADFDAATLAYRQADARRIGCETERVLAQNHFNEAQSQLFAAENEFSRREQALQHARALRALAEQELNQIERQLAELDQRQAAEQRRQLQTQHDVEELQARLDHADEAELQARQAQDDAERALHQAQQQAERLQAEAEQPLLRAEGERVRVQALRKALHQLQMRSQALHAEAGGLDAEPLRQQLTTIEHALRLAEDDIDTLQRQLDDADAELGELREQRRRLDAALHDDRQQLQRVDGRLTSLETLQQAALRDDDPAYRSWLVDQGLDRAPRLVDLLRVSEGWEPALELWLGDWLAAPVVDQQQAQRLAALPAEALPSAGLRWLIDGAHALPAAQDETQLAAPLLSEVLIEAPAALRAMLAGVHAVATRAELSALAAKLPAGHSALAIDGSAAATGWQRSAGSVKANANAGMLSRAPQIEALRQQRGQLRAQIAAADAALTSLRERLQQLELARRAAAQQLEATRGRAAQALGQRQAQQVRVEQIEARSARLHDDLQALGDERERHAEDLDAAEQALVTLDAQAQQLRDDKARLQQAIHTARDQHARARQTLTQTLQQAAQLRVQLARAESTLSAIEQTLRDIDDSRQHHLQDREARAQAASTHDLPLQTQQVEVQAAREVVESARHQLALARQGLESSEAAWGAAQQQQRQCEQQRDRCRDALQQAELAQENFRARRSALAEQFGEAVEQAEADEATLREAAGADIELAEQRLAQLQRRIERLGAINLAAVDELREAEQRSGYLQAQVLDLSTALDSLEAAIRKIDGETRERFRQTFDRVDTVFRDRFPKLFGGGEAWLELTGDNLLDTGVKVIARPPGKRNSSIQMLSGGEKAMTAVALLLALFQLNPAPFCLMDEVDAPLDDANVGRFCAVVREMSASVQFIIITHNKITMELAQQLLGVTMQEPGVSRLVSVDVEQAVALTRA